MVSWIGMRQEAFPYERAPRFAGTTKYPFVKMLKFAFDAITGFSVKPLRFASYLGVVGALMSMLLGACVLYAWFEGQTVLGWTSLAVIMLLMGSCQLIVLGILGEYVGRLYIESKNRPLYVIQEILAGSSKGRGTS